MDPLSDESPPTQRNGCLARKPVGGVVLAIGLRRSFTHNLRYFLHEQGYAAVATSSEVQALELLQKGDLFDAIVIEPSSFVESRLCILRQIGARRPALPVFVVGDDVAPDARIDGTVASESLISTITTEARLLVCAIRDAVTKTQVEQPQCVTQATQC
jgi:DNA-binding NtrC family response regulator